MSQGNVEIVRRIYDAVARRDAAIPFELYAKDIVWDLSHWRPAELDPMPVYTGHEGVREAWRDRLSAWGEVDFDVEELMEAGDRVVAVIRDRQVGRSSGVPVKSAHAAVWTLVDGKVTRLQVFDERQQAVEAAGLSERLAALRAVYEEWGKGNFHAGVDLLDRLVLYIPTVEVPDAGYYVGPEGAKEFLRRWLESWTNLAVAADEFIEAGDSVVVIARQEGIGRDSGTPIEMRFFNVWTFRGRAVIRLEFFADRAEALAAVGLSE